MSEGKKVLVIEDDPNIGPMMKLGLEDYGHTITLISAEQLTDPLQRELYEGYDAFIVDIMLPKINGKVILAFIKDNFPDKLRIAFTAKPDLFDLQALAHHVFIKGAIGMGTLSDALRFA